MQAHVLSKNRMNDLVDALGKDHRVVGPVTKENKFVFDELSAGGADLRLDYPISVLPPKKFFFPQYETLVKFKGGQPAGAHADFDTASTACQMNSKEEQHGSLEQKNRPLIHAAIGKRQKDENRAQSPKNDLFRHLNEPLYLSLSYNFRSHHLNWAKKKQEILSLLLFPSRINFIYSSMFDDP
jgi:hypothetical protein